MRLGIDAVHAMPMVDGTEAHSSSAVPYLSALPVIDAEIYRRLVPVCPLFLCEKG